MKTSRPRQPNYQCSPNPGTLRSWQHPPYLWVVTSIPAVSILFAVFAGFVHSVVTVGVFSTLLFLVLFVGYRWWGWYLFSSIRVACFVYYDADAHATSADCNYELQQHSPKYRYKITCIHCFWPKNNTKTKPKNNGSGRYREWAPHRYKGCCQPCSRLYNLEDHVSSTGRSIGASWPAETTPFISTISTHKWSAFSLLKSNVGSCLELSSAASHVFEIGCAML